MKLIYYSLVSTGDDLREKQLVESFRSLRRHDDHTPVFLVTYGGAPGFVLEEAGRCGVTLVEAGAYRDFLLNKHARGNLLASIPTYHKLLSLRQLPLHEASQILYLDCDTFFFRGVEQLFEACAYHHWYAREEPNSRRSPYGYDRKYLDESVLEGIAANEGLNAVIPCNTGICLMNHGLWWRLIDLETAYLDLAWRLTVGLEMRAAKASRPGREGSRGILGSIDSFDIARAIPYPSSNAWIIDEIATWLTLGHIPGLAQGFLPRELVLQGGEYYENPSMRDSCVAIHYFSNAMTRFFATVIPYIARSEATRR